MRDGRSDEDVSDEDDGPITSMMSLVSGGLVLVIVEVVVDESSTVDDESENGATYSSGAGSVVSTWRTTNIVNHTIRPMAASAAALAASRVGVRSCHLGSPVTATDSSPGSFQLPDDLRAEERQVIEVRHVQNLQVDPLNSGPGEGDQLVDDLTGGAGER